jgi:hypothetical protein
MAQRGEIPERLGSYGTGIESALVAYMVGGSFIPFQYCEMAWHFFALTIALERVAANEAAAVRAREASAAKPPLVEKPTEEFAWA